MADPSKVKGIVPRAVVRVVTPGTVTDTDQLDARANLYLAAVDAGVAAPAIGALADGRRDGSLGLALLDLSTGELAAASVPGGGAGGAPAGGALGGGGAGAGPRGFLSARGRGGRRAAVWGPTPGPVPGAGAAPAAADVGRAIDAAGADPTPAAARREPPPLALR